MITDVGWSGRPCERSGSCDGSCERPTDEELARWREEEEEDVEVDLQVLEDQRARVRARWAEIKRAAGME